MIIDLCVESAFNDILFQGLYFIKDMKSDPKILPQLMEEKKAILTVKHLSKENQKKKLLVYYEVYFGVVKVAPTKNADRKSRKPNRRRTFNSNIVY